MAYAKSIKLNAEELEHSAIDALAYKSCLPRSNVDSALRDAVKLNEVL